ncbi:MAG: formate dehydrogenase accessory sulfurtransferase FdhD [Emticicia sp.]|nr:formate dehydrogenase accessory sulfurtransferase FdhD [Emticicia sp.]
MYGIKSFEIKKFKPKGIEETPDLVVIEEPLEIRLGFGEEQNRQQKSISVTMRTPTGHDFELALGFLFTESIISNFDDIHSINYCTDTGKQTEQNIVRVELKSHIRIDFQSLERHFYSTSSCGICGKASIEAIEQKCPVLPKTEFKVSAEFIKTLPKILAINQVFFQYTGGLHAAMIIYDAGRVVLREDIGRHNALDKVIGAALQQNLLPLSDAVLIMSSRASFELIQKSAMAGISLMACIGSPSSLAIETAQTLGITLIGFLREDSFNVYSHTDRIF